MARFAVEREVPSVFVNCFRYVCNVVPHLLQIKERSLGLRRNNLRGTPGVDRGAVSIRCRIWLLWNHSKQAAGIALHSKRGLDDKAMTIGPF